MDFADSEGLEKSESKNKRVDYSLQSSQEKRGKKKVIIMLPF